ncbi:LYR motif containing protein 1-like isoform X1 [Clinocottus analis]|uniref:LYR motif containing protein 1-like isoform X1 n=1 Tax=Clinocottus analis TaxID=304258 RepID=UPI0035C0738D
MTASTRRTVLSLYTRVFRIARSWQAQSGAKSDTETERKYILQEASSLFRQNQQLTDQESIQRSIEECKARIEIGLHYRNPYPRPVSKNNVFDKLDKFLCEGYCVVEEFPSFALFPECPCRRTCHSWDWQLRKAGS